MATLLLFPLALGFIAESFLSYGSSNLWGFIPFISKTASLALLSVCKALSSDGFLYEWKRQKDSLSRGN